MNKEQDYFSQVPPEQRIDPKVTTKKAAIARGLFEEYAAPVDEVQAEEVQRFLANVVEQTVIGVNAAYENDTILGNIQQHPTYLREVDDQTIIDMIDLVRLAWAAPFTE